MVLHLNEMLLNSSSCLPAVAAAVDDDDVYEDDEEELDLPPVEEVTASPESVQPQAMYPEGLPGVETVFVFPNNVQRRKYRGCFSACHNSSTSCLDHEIATAVLCQISEDFKIATGC